MSLLGIYIMDDFIPETPGLVQMSFLLSYLGLFNFLLGKYPCSAIEQTTATNIRFFHCLSASFLEGTTSWPTMAHPYHHDNLRVPLPNPNPTTTPPRPRNKAFFSRFHGWGRKISWVGEVGGICWGWWQCGTLKIPMISCHPWELLTPKRSSPESKSLRWRQPLPPTSSKKKKMVEWIYTNKWWALEKRMSGFNCGVSG